MDSSVSPKDEIRFLRVCHHVSTGLYFDVGKREKANGERQKRKERRERIRRKKEQYEGCVHTVRSCSDVTQLKLSGLTSKCLDKIASGFSRNR